MFRTLDRSRAPVPTLRALRAADYSVLLQVGGPMFLPRRYRSFHVVGIPLSDGYSIARSGDGDRWAARLSGDDVSLHAAGPGERIEWPEGASCLYIHLRPAFVARCAGGGEAGIETHHRLCDPVIREIGTALLAVVASGVGERPAEALMNALGSHLSRRYAAAPPAPVMLGSRPLDDVLDDLRHGVARASSIDELARTCGLSRSYFTRRFRAVTHGSPHAALLSSRVERAKHLLVERQHSISESAYATGFVDQSHLSHTFRRLVGMTPRRYGELHRRTVEAMQGTQGTNLQDRA